MSPRQAVLPALSVVMPAYNEEESIASAIAEVRECCLAVVPGSELIVVDDGSRDATAEIVRRIAAEDHRVRLVSQTNGGHGRALLTGLEKSTGRWILLVDSDQQIPLDGFAAAWSLRTGLDAVLGSRQQRVDSATRRFVTATLRNLVRLLLGARLADANAPFKLIRRPAWEDCRRFIPADCLIPSVFLAVALERHGWRHRTLPVAHRPRLSGTGSLLGPKLLKFCLRATRQLLALRIKLTLIPTRLPEVEPFAEVS